MKQRVFQLLCLYLFLYSSFADSNLSTESQKVPKEEPAYHLSNLDSILADILWCGGDKEIVLILSDNGSIYRSTDKGFKWTKMTEIFQRTGYVELEKGESVSKI